MPRSPEPSHPGLHPADDYPDHVRALLRTPRWIAFTSIVIGVIVAFGLLSHWQFSRAQEREQQAVQIAGPAGPVETDPLTSGVVQWQRVRILGAYADAPQRAVRKRPLNGANGFWVMSLFDTPTGSVWVNRGWLPATNAADVAPVLPMPPAGKVVVSGVVREFEPPQPRTGLPDAVIMSVDPSSLDLRGDLDGYIQLQASQPTDASLTPVPLPEVDSSRNISYAVQWLLFAGVAITGWWWMLAREARESRRESPASEPQASSVAN